MHIVRNTPTAVNWHTHRVPRHGPAHVMPNKQPAQNTSVRACRAGEGTRTLDRGITNAVLYQLSYAGFCILTR